MKGLESGQDKLRKICDVLKRETLEPAQQEGEQIVADARMKAGEILADAQALAKKMLEDARSEIEKQKEVFQATLVHASRQAVEALKESLEQRLFNPELAALVTQPLQDPAVIARLMGAVVHALEKEGTEGDISAVISSSVSARSVNELLASEVLKRLKEKSVVIGTLAGGVEIKLHKDNVTLVLTAEWVQEMLATYIRKDFREFVFRGV